MKDFLTDLSLYQTIFFIIAASSTIILVIQTILALFGFSENDSDISEAMGGDSADIDTSAEIGLDSDIDADADIVDTDIAERGQAMVHDNGLRLFTVRGILAFLMMGSWVGFLLSKSGVPDIIASACAFASGVTALVFIAKIMQMLLGLQEDGTLKVKNALGQVGQVYIRIPGEEKGMGKVNVTVQERLCEFDAVTEKSETIKTGEMVYVTDVRAGNVLVVEKTEEL